MADSKIEWTEKVWNPVRGCSLVSPGCTNCYAMRQAHRFSGEAAVAELAALREDLIARGEIRRVASTQVRITAARGSR